LAQNRNLRRKDQSGAFRAVSALLTQCRSLVGARIAGVFHRDPARLGHSMSITGRGPDPSTPGLPGAVAKGNARAGCEGTAVPAWAGQSPSALMTGACRPRADQLGQSAGAQNRLELKDESPSAWHALCFAACRSRALIWMMALHVRTAIPDVSPVNVIRKGLLLHGKALSRSRRPPDHPALGFMRMREVRGCAPAGRYRRRHWQFATLPRHVLQSFSAYPAIGGLHEAADGNHHVLWKFLPIMTAG
jgi:hypothetical protein